VNEVKLIEKKKTLPTPDWARSAGYVRCNCKIGVPSTGNRFDPVPARMFVGNIKILQYDDIIDGYSASRPTSKKQRKEEGNNNYDNDDDDDDDEEELKLLQLRKQQQIDLLPVIFSYLKLYECAVPAIVSKEWNFGANNYYDYRDIRDCIPWTVLRPHKGFTTSLYYNIIDNKIFSCGDKKLIISDVYQGE
jgi:hypothetical protein